MLHLIFNTPHWAEVTDLDCDGLRRLAAAGAPVIDIRREDEWDETGVIPGSLLLTFFDERKRYDLPLWLAGFDAVASREAPFILVCRNGIRTRRVGRYLDGREGWPQVHHLEGGIRRWLAAGLPVEPYDPLAGAGNARHGGS